MEQHCSCSPEMPALPMRTVQVTHASVNHPDPGLCWYAVLDKHLPMQALRPTLFIGVPRVFDKLYDGVYAKLALARPLQRLLFHLAFWWKQRQIRAGYKWDKVLFPSKR